MQTNFTVNKRDKTVVIFSKKINGEKKNCMMFDKTKNILLIDKGVFDFFKKDMNFSSKIINKLFINRIEIRFSMKELEFLPSIQVLELV